MPAVIVVLVCVCVLWAAGSFVLILKYARLYRLCQTLQSKTLMSGRQELTQAVCDVALYGTAFLMMSHGHTGYEIHSLDPRTVTIKTGGV